MKKSKNYQNSFIILELLIVIVLLSILYNTFIPKKNDSKLFELKNNIVLQLKFLRYKALTESFNSKYENSWFKKLWTIKFQRCRKSVGGVYYAIYSDKNSKGHINRAETLKDPLTNKYIYANNYCTENSKDSKYTLLSKNFNIKDVEISCNETSSLGQISFDFYSNTYSKLGYTKD
ncbi:MAG: type II secretion system protein, partial [Campylobacterota bacterium]